MARHSSSLVVGRDATMSDEDFDEDDEWYSRMEEQGRMYYDNEDEVMHPGVQQEAEEPSETDYFAKMGENQDRLFEAEDGLVWQRLARQVASDSSAPAGRSAGKLIALSHSDRESCALLLLKQWAFSFVPQSLGIYCCLQEFETATNPASSSKVLYVDDVAHPSFILFSSYAQYANEVSFHLFAPYKTFESTRTFLQEALRLERSKYPDCEFTFASVNSELHAEVMLKADCKIQRSDIYYMFALNDKPSFSERKLPEGFHISNLELPDAERINATWKYRSSSSIFMVREMIEAGHGVGIRETASNELVSWCLTYEDGALGMLYTLEDCRGKGFARDCVIAAVVKRPPSLIQPYCFIDTTNEASQALFRSLGFTKCQDVFWVYLEK